MGELQQKADRVNLFVHQKNRLEKIGEIFKKLDTSITILVLKSKDSTHTNAININ